MKKILDGYRITSPYGWRMNPFGGGREFHSGIDLVKADKAPIRAFIEGTVLFAGMGRSGTGLGGYGNVVVMKDRNGCAHVYAHLAKTEVKKDADVTEGQVIGYQGATGRVTGSHLHFEIRKKSSPKYGWTANQAQSTLDPIQYLQSYHRKDSGSGQTYKVNGNISGYATANDASRKVNKKTTIKAGVYSIFNTSAGMINVTGKKGIPGSWINPAENAEKWTGNQKLILPRTSASWRVYPTDRRPVRGNEIGFLNPGKFRGLEYDIIGNPQKDIYTINTRDFGMVNIYAAKETGAKVH